MASLALTKVFVNLIPTGEAVSAQSSSRSRDDSLEGEFRQYAGGRRRSITSEGVTTRFAFILHLITGTNLETLRSWMGRTVEVRDHRGQQFYCSYHAVGTVEHKDPALYDAVLACESVTYTEGV